MSDEPENERYLKYLAPLTYNSSLNVSKTIFLLISFAGKSHRLVTCSRSNKHFFQCRFPDQFPEIIPVENLYGPLYSKPVKRCQLVADFSFYQQQPASKKARTSSPSVAEPVTFNFQSYFLMRNSSLDLKKKIEEHEMKNSDNRRLSTIFSNFENGVLIQKIRTQYQRCHLKNTIKPSNKILLNLLL
jgi:hypothetical protein